MKIVIGIDYSITSPAISVHVGDIWSNQNIRIFFLTQTKKYLKSEREFLVPNPYPLVKFRANDDMANMERFCQLTKWSIKSIFSHSPQTNEWIPPTVFLEAYSYGSIGKHSQIAENTAILKRELLVNNIDWNVISPRSIKKFATGNGNATKLDMYNSFIADTGVALAADYDKCNPQSSPISDIVDSYFICKYGYCNGEKK